MSTERFDALARRAAPLFDRVESSGLSSLTGPERVLFSVWGAAGQIENGGFDQFFYNSSGDYAAEAVEAFRAIGAVAKAAVIARALALFPNAAPPRDRDERIGALDALTARAGEDVFESLDEAFYASPEDVDAMLAVYVQAHDDEIAPAPGPAADV